MCYCFVFVVIVVVSVVIISSLVEIGSAIADIYLLLCFCFVVDPTNLPLKFS